MVLPAFPPALLAVAVSAILAACSPGKPPATIESAQARLAAGEPRAAAIELQGVLQATPTSGQARMLLGKALLNLGDAIGAEVELKKARELKHPDAEVVPLLAKAMVEQQRHKQVIDQFGALDLKDAAAQDELNATLASAWARLGKRDKARSLVDAVLAKSPDHVTALLSSARLHATGSKIDEALAEAGKATTLEANNADAWLTLGQIQLLGKRDTEGAAASYRKVLTLRPAAAGAYTTLVAIALLKNDEAGALKLYRDMEKALPRHPQTRVVDIQLALKRKDYPRAKEVALELLKIAPDNADVLNLAGIAELEMGRVSRAITHFQRAIYLAPELPAPKVGLAHAYLRGGQPKRTLALLAPMLAKNPDDIGSLTLAADAELQAGNSERAEVLFQRALKARPGDPQIRTSLALTQMTQGRADAALTELRSIASTDQSTVGDLALISTMMRQRNVPAALDAIAALAKKLPASPQPDLLRGQVLLGKGDMPAARASYEAALKKEPTHKPAIQGLAAIDLREGKPEAAEARFAAALAADPKSTAAMMALVDLKSRRPAAAEEVSKLLADAIAASPNDPAPRLKQLQLLLLKRDRKGALGAAQAAVSALPDNTELLGILGKVQLLAGDANQAVNTFGKLAARDPQSAQPVMYQAEAYVMLKDNTAAERAYKRALELAPNSVEAQRGLIAVSVRANNPARALEAARGIQRQNPKLGLGYMLEGDIQGKFNDWAAAAKAYRAGLDKGNFVGLSERLHLATAKSKGDAAAQAFASDWIKQHPEDAGLPFYLGNQAMDAGNLERAESYLAQAVKANAKLVAPINNLAMVKIKLGRSDALATAQQAYALAPDRSEPIDTLVQALRQAKQDAKAVDLLQSALAKTPDSPLFRFNLAQIHADAGDKPAARRELELLAASPVAFERKAEADALLKQVSQ